MQELIAKIEEINAAVNNVVWGIPMLVLLLAVGVYLTVGTGFFQITKFGYAMKNTILAVFRDKSVVRSSDHKAISQFQALATALAATVGTGNIVGVATAIAAGGPGAIFWMWVSAFFGMMTKYAEIVLGIYFRHKNEEGEWVGGPMYYIEKGLHQKWLSILFCVFCLFASFGIGSIAQVNGISTAMQSSFHVPEFVTGIIVCALTAVIIIGGMKRIVTVTEKFVPIMALLYIVGALAVIVANYRNILPALSEIFTGAFQLRSVSGGVMGYAIARAMRYGFARGVFSNEAGLGSSVLVHSSVDVKEPVLQGLWGIFEVFFDTIVICTLTALAVLTTGAHAVSGLEGVNITMYAFESVFGRFGSYIVSVGLVLFAFSTLLGGRFTAAASRNISAANVLKPSTNSFSLWSCLSVRCPAFSWFGICPTPSTGLWRFRTSSVCCSCRRLSLKSPITINAASGNTKTFPRCFPTTKTTNLKRFTDGN